MGYPYPTCPFSEYHLDQYTIELKDSYYCYMKASKHASYSSTLFGARGLCRLFLSHEGEERCVYSQVTAREEKKFGSLVGSIKTLQSIWYMSTWLLEKGS